MCIERSFGEILEENLEIRLTYYFLMELEIGVIFLFQTRSLREHLRF